MNNRTCIKVAGIFCRHVPYLHPVKINTHEQQISEKRLAVFGIGSVTVMVELRKSRLVVELNPVDRTFKTTSKSA